MWKSWANLLTLCRLALALPCAAAIVHGAWGSAALLFAAAVASDLLDGPLARRFDQATPLGGLLDHATDAWFVCAVLVAFAIAGPVTWVLPLAVVAAFTQYMLDSRALAGRPLRASWLGRSNGIAYFVLGGGLLAQRTLGFGWPTDAVWATLGWLLVASTLGSMADRASAAYRGGRSADAPTGD